MEVTGWSPDIVERSEYSFRSGVPRTSGKVRCPVVLQGNVTIVRIMCGTIYVCTVSHFLLGFLSPLPEEPLKRCPSLHILCNFIGKIPFLVKRRKPRMMVRVIDHPKNKTSIGHGINPYISYVKNV